MLSDVLHSGNDAARVPIARDYRSLEEEDDDEE
jgi:hypothetical protein